MILADFFIPRFFKNPGSGGPAGLTPRVSRRWEWRKGGNFIPFCLYIDADIPVCQGFMYFWPKQRDKHKCPL